MDFVNVNAIGEAGIGTDRSDKEERKTFWENGKSSKPTVSREGKRLAEGCRMPVGYVDWVWG